MILTMLKEFSENFLHDKLLKVWGWGWGAKVDLAFGRLYS